MRALTLIVAFGALSLVASPGHDAGAADPAHDGRAVGKVPRIALLNPGTVAIHAPLYEAFKQGLREYGYIEGQNIVIEQRWAEGRHDRLSAAAAELVRLKPDVIVVAGASATQAARQATATIPIVMAIANDPVGLGFVASLARPRGNITGLNNQAEDLIHKMLDLLKGAVPKATRIGVLGNPDNPAHAINWRETLAAAKVLGMRVDLGEVRRPAEIEAAFAAIMQHKPDALLVMPDPIIVTQGQQIADLAAKHRLPAIYPFRELVEVGGLMSYGASLRDHYRRAARYVDKILKGAKPGDLPVEQPMLFEFVVNLRAAKALGLTIPAPVMLRATEVIQ